MSEAPPAPPAALAAALLRDWETRTPAHHAPSYSTSRAALLARLTTFSAWLLRPADVHVDAEDARAVLRRARAFRLGHATATGPGRATRLGPLLAVDSQLFPALAPLPYLRPVAALLSLVSGPRHELEMDELTEILETVQQTLLTPDTEMVFGHGSLPEADETGLQAWLLVGYEAA